jgi:hypothetical protein
MRYVHGETTGLCAHGFFVTHPDRLHDDLRAFTRAGPHKGSPPSREEEIEARL